MKAESIKALLADPNIDPTEWVGKALLGWVASNPLIVLSDPHARKYLFQGMDLNDAKVLSKGVCEQYRESKDPTIIRNFINALNPVAKRTSDYSAEWTHGNIVTALQAMADANIIDALVSIESPGRCGNSPPGVFWSHFRPDHVKKLIANRSPAKWSVSHWEKMIDVLPKEELYEYSTSYLIPKQLNQRVDHGDYPRKVQKILWRIFLRLPEKHAREWLAYLEKTQFDNCWSGYSYDLISKKKKNDGIYFNELVCGCGVVAASKSGLTLHQNKCYGHHPSLIESARFLVAQSDPLMCNKCGRTCKTSSGMTLHEKNCKVEKFNFILEDRKSMNKELENVNTNENPVSGQTNPNQSGLLAGV
jgi:hypothetical protein